MIHIVLSALVGVVVTALFAFLFGGSITAISVGIIPGLIAGIGFFVWKVRVVSKDVEALMNQVQAIMQAPAQVRSIEQQNNLRHQRVKQAIEILEKGYIWKNRHPGIVGQIDGQIGMLLYIDGQNIPATPYLERSSVRNWMSRAMYAATKYKQNKIDEMKSVFEGAIRFNKKEALLWNVYAWCLWSKNDTDGAIEVLNRAQKHLKADARTQSNLDALRNGRPMKMDYWREAWMQFRLDDSLQRQQQAALQPNTRMDRRSMYRGR